MPFEIVRDDIAHMAVDAIVTSTDPLPQRSGGADARLREVAGPELAQARARLGQLSAGCAVATDGFLLPARYVIHTVSPVWNGGGQEQQLQSCYHNALILAQQLNCRSIAFPLIGSGSYGFPSQLALKLALQVIEAFLLEQEMHIYLVVFHREAYLLSEKLHAGIRSYIDEHYVQMQAQRSLRLPRQAKAAAPMLPSEDICCAPCASLADILQQQDAGFSQRLLQLIDQAGKKDSQVYKKANLSKQHFSKIRNNPDYKPTKSTAIALALALELDLEQTRELIGRAGYALTNSSKFDLIIRYFIQQKNYDIIEINLALYEFDQPLLGG